MKKQEGILSKLASVFSVAIIVVTVLVHIGGGIYLIIFANTPKDNLLYTYMILFGILLLGMFLVVRHLGGKIGTMKARIEHLEKKE